MQGRKNYWLYIIIGMLLFGVLMIGISLTIALKNPIQDENTFFTSKRELDEQINSLIREQNAFLSAYKPTFYILDSQGEHRLDGFTFPYMTKPKEIDKLHKDDFTRSTIESQVKLALRFVPNTSMTPTIRDIALYLDSPIQSNKFLKLGTFAQTQDSHSSTLHFISTSLSLPHGRWKLVVEITFDEGHKAYFEREIFVS